MLKLESLTRQTEHAKKYFENKIAFTMGPVELKTAMDEKENIQIIDVRTAEHYEKSHLPTAISIPAKELQSHLSKLSKDKINILYCYSEQCHLAAKCAILLAENGYPVMELEGGFEEWRNSDYMLES